jgi:phosphatidate cytidylyltransferase
MFGKLLGGPKLTKISPNKTYAGMCGSYLFSYILGIFLFIFYQ